MRSSPKPTSSPSVLSRRRFLASGSTGVASLGWLGTAACARLDGRPGDEHAPGTGKADGWDTTDAGDASLADGGDGGRAQPTCGELTEPSIEGPFYTPGSPARRTLRDPGAEGVVFALRGRVLTQDCTPVAGAFLDFWQADHHGDYDNVGFHFRGHQFTDALGRYALETVVPGHYLNGAQYRPAHLHVKVGGAGLMLLTTQLYFAGDPFNTIDPFLHESLIMPTRPGLHGGVEASFDFVVPETGPSPGGR